MIDFDEEEPLNRKDITAEITGKGWDFDEEETAPEIAPEETPTTPSEPHPFVGIMDMLISTSQEPLAKAGYPAPNLSVWETWGKPNLSKAFYQYLPMESAAGAAINSPAFAGVIGLGALVIAFLPVIMYHVKKKDEEKKAKREQMIEQAHAAEQARTAPPAPTPVSEPQMPKNGMKIELPDNPAEPKYTKLAGGGEEANLPIPMMELIAQNIGADAQPI